MLRIFLAGAALLSASAASAAYYPVPGATVSGGEDITQTISVSGIDPLVDSVFLDSFVDIYYGLNWMEDFGNGPEIWGNEYFDSHPVSLAAGDTYSFTGQLTTFAGYFFLYELSARLIRDGDDLLAIIRLRMGDTDIRCSSAIPPFTTCGVRPDYGMWSVDLFVDGPNGDGAVITSRIGPTVPEPATWALMIAGFGLVGAAARRRAVAAA